MRPMSLAIRLSAAALFLAQPIRAVAAEPGGPASLTIYGGGLAQVSERRAIAPADGARDIVLAGVSERMMPESVRLAGVGGPLAVRALSFRRARLTPANLLKHSVGREVWLIRRDPTTGEETTVPARVLSAAGGLVLRVGGHIETPDTRRIAFPDETYGLLGRPALTARVEAPSRTTALDLTYLTHGLSWQADYVATLGKPDADGRLTLDLVGRATVKNDTGLSFPAAAVSLVAGEVAGAGRPGPQPKLMRAMGAVAEDAGAPVPVAFGAFRLYRLPDTTGLATGESRQVALVAADGIAAEERLIAARHANVFGGVDHPGPPVHAAVRLTFANEGMRGAAKGLPLPAGTVRVYRAGPAGAPLFAGAAGLPDVPPGERVRLALGRAFDVTARYARTAFKRLDDRGRTVEAAFRVTLANGRDTAARVRVEETLPGDWEILEASQPATRRGSAAVWTVAVPAGGKTDLTYRVRVRR